MKLFRRHRPPVHLASDGFTLPFSEAIDYLRQKISLPSKTWRDLVGRAHDRAFVVAGATKEALIADLRQAVDDAIAKGLTLKQFTDRFEEAVAKHGWTGWTGEGSAAGRAWRARVIYNTNIRTAYAAGRFKQMTDPDLLKVRPYWQYVHGMLREPERPRPEHVAWDGMVLRWDDDWWDAHYPPCEFECTCGVRPISRRELKAMGKEGPDNAPAVVTRSVLDPRTGETIQVPQGVGLGWDHTPGRDWAAGLVPPELQKPLAPSDALGPRTGTNNPPLSEIARPLTSARMAGDLPQTEYLDAFLAEFGASREQAALYRDQSGHVVPISKDLFERSSGALKSNAYGRGPDALRQAEALKDPDEIWIDWSFNLGTGDTKLVRRYLRYDPEGGAFTSFEWSTQGWHGVTTFPPKLGKSAKAQADYLLRLRTGALLYRRNK